MKKEQLSKVESRLLNMAKLEAQRIVSEAVNEIAEAHDMRQAQIVVEDAKYYLVEMLVEAPKVKDNEPDTHV